MGDVDGGGAIYCTIGWAFVLGATLLDSLVVVEEEEKKKNVYT